MRFSKGSIPQIEKTLRLHINYKGIPSNGKYLRDMDILAINYSGPRGLALSNMLDDYFKVVGVKNLDEALERLRGIDELS